MGGASRCSAGTGSGAPAGHGCHRRRGCPRGQPWDVASGVVWRSSGRGELWANGAWEKRGGGGGRGGGDGWGAVEERKKEKKEKQRGKKKIGKKK